MKPIGETCIHLLFTNVLYACMKEKIYGRDIGRLGNDGETQRHKLEGAVKTKKSFGKGTAAKSHMVRTLPSNGHLPLHHCCWSYRFHRLMPPLLKGIFTVLFYAHPFLQNSSPERSVMYSNPGCQGHGSFQLQKWEMGFILQDFWNQELPEQQGEFKCWAAKHMEKSIVASKILLIGSSMLVNV